MRKPKTLAKPKKATPKKSTKQPQLLPGKLAFLEAGGKESRSLKLMTKAFYDYQDERQRLHSRLGITDVAYELDVAKGVYNVAKCAHRKGVPERDTALLMYLSQRAGEVHAMEKKLEAQVTAIVKEHPLWKTYLKGVKGCGPLMAAAIITNFDIRKAEAVSNLWSFAGLAPGKDKKVKGKKCTYNQWLRAKLCGVLGSGFIKTRKFEDPSIYIPFYDNMRVRLHAKNWGIDSPNPTDKRFPKANHQHRAAVRYMVKMFLKDLYVAWRTLEGLPVREPYAEEYLDKVHHTKVKAEYPEKKEKRVAKSK